MFLNTNVTVCLTVRVHQREGGIMNCSSRLCVYIETNNSATCVTRGLSVLSLLFTAELDSHRHSLRVQGWRCAPGLEYQVNLLCLQVLDTAVTRILHQKCTRICHFQTKRLVYFL